MRLQDIIMRESPSSYIFDSDGTVHRQRRFDGEDQLQLAQANEAARIALAAK
jgi:hypothetical protein